MKKRWLPQFVSEFRDRHGKPRYRFRRNGHVTYYFKSAPGTPKFLEELKACLDGVSAPAVDVGADRTVPGSFNDLIARYYRSPEYLSPGDSTRAVYRGVIERFRAEHGHRMVGEMRVRDVDTLLGRKAATPTAANMLRKVLKRMMDFAIRQGMRRDNPVLPTRAYKANGDGFHTWTEDEISRFEVQHPLGTKARLALALLLYTGQRRSDVIRMGRQHVENGRIRVTQQKTKARLLLPIHPRLAEAIAAVPADNLTYLVTQFGKPFTAAGFGNWFRDRCNEAGLPSAPPTGCGRPLRAAWRRLGCPIRSLNP